MVVLQGVRYGHVTVDGKEYASDVWVFADGRVLPRPHGDIVGIPEVMRLLDAQPDVIVVGRGLASRLHVDDGARAVLADRGIELIEVRTAEVLRIANERRHRQRVAAIVHVTD